MTLIPKSLDVFESKQELEARLSEVERQIQSFEEEFSDHPKSSLIRYQAYVTRNIAVLEQDKQVLEEELHELVLQFELLGKLHTKIPELTAYRIQRSLAAYPFWATCRKKQINPYRYESSNGQTWLEVYPNSAFGQATARDSSILSVIISYAKEIQLKHGSIPYFIPITRYKLLNSLGRADGGKQYRELSSALDRLTSTYYKGNIFGESLLRGTLLSIHSQEDPDGPENILLVLDPTIRMALGGKLVYALPKQILLDDSLLRQEVAKKVWIHLGKQPSWQISLEQFSKMVSYHGSLRHFKHELSKYEDFFCSWFTVQTEGRGKKSKLVFSKI